VSQEARPSPKDDTPLDLSDISVMDPRLFVAIEALARIALDYGGNHAAVRSAVGRVVGELRKMAESKRGHDTVEAIALAKLLERRDGLAVSSEASSLVSTNLYLLRRLSGDQHAAANFIRDIWNAFSRFLTMKAKTMDDSGGARASKPLGPFEVMSQDTYDNWREFYVPWFTEAHQRWVSNRNGSHQYRHTALVMYVVVEDRHPMTVDRGLRLVAGTTLRTIRAELNAFNKRGAAVCLSEIIAGVE